MYGDISQHQKNAAEDGQSNSIRPQCEVVEAERAENGGAGDVDVEPVFVIREAQIPDFVDDQAFEAEVED